MSAAQLIAAAESLAPYAAHHREVHAARLEQYEALQAQLGGNVDAYAAATLDFGVRYERAVLEWFDNLPPSVTGVTR